MTLGINVTIRNARADKIRDARDAGAGAGFARIYDGTRPATGGAATTLLAELTFSKPSAANASGGVSTLNAVTTDPSANATGTATWYREVDSAGNHVQDGSVGTSGADLNLTTVSIVLGQPVSVSSGTYTEGNA